MDHVASILREILRTAGLRQGVANYGFFGRWSQVVGEPLARSTKPVRVQGNTLWVHVDNSTLVHHLTFLAPKMLERIRQASPETTITSVRFTLNPGP